MSSFTQYTSLLLIGCVLSLAACGGAPKPAVTKKVQKKQKVPGVPDAASSAFQDGVAELQKAPPNYIGAVKAFQASVDAYDRYSVAWLNLAYSFERLGRYNDAADAYRKLIYKERVVDRTISLALGRALLMSGKADQAIVEFESVLRKHNKDLQARNNLAAAYLKKGDTKTSLRYVKEVLAVQPKNVPAIVNLGLLYLKDKKLLLAELMFKKALNYEKQNARALNNLGLTYYTLNRIPEAVVSFEKAIAIDPTMDEARLNLASILLDYLDYPRSLTEFQAVRARFPKHYQAMIGEADSLYGVGKYPEAVALYEESFGIRDNNPEALLRAGKIYEEQLNKPKKALALYLRFQDVAKPPATHPIVQTIQFLQQADKMKNSQTGGAAESGQAPSESAEGVDGTKSDEADPKKDGGADADKPAEGKKDGSTGEQPSEGDASGGDEDKS